MSGVQQKSQGKQRDRKRGQFKGKTPTETCPWKTCVRACLVASDSAAPWAVARRAPLSMGFSRQEHWCGLPCPPSGDLPDPGIEPAFLYLLRWQVGSLPLASPGKPQLDHIIPHLNSCALIFFLGAAPGSSVIIGNIFVGSITG